MTKFDGLLVVFEGPECGGKSTQIKSIKEWLELEGLDVVATREPGGSEISEAIGSLLRNPDYKDMTPETEMFLFQASRAQFCKQVLRPHLESGKVVLLDRFKDSSVVYQGGVRELGLELIKELNSISTKGIVPDISYLLDLPVEETMRRIRKSGKNERIDNESEEFHRKVREYYLSVAKTDKWIVIDATKDIPTVLGELKRNIESNLLSRGFLETSRLGKER